jgi:uncharacterized protein YndB with AHSA1/START domain
MPDNVFVISRTLDAPRDLVWKACTEPDRLKEWFGPSGFPMIACTMDLRVGGTFHYGLRGPDGSEMWGKWIFREIVKPERMVIIQFFSDRSGGVTRHPMAPNWPLETLSTMTLAEEGRRTTLTINWSAHNATDAERAMFDSSHSGMEQGWSGTFKQLTDYLAKETLEKK